jgi:fibronectin type 3 domain-containing protein
MPQRNREVIMGKKSNFILSLTIFFFYALPFLLLSPALTEGVVHAASDPASLAEAVDNDTLVFETGGDADWFSQNTRFYYGRDAAESGNVADSQETWLKTTVTGPGTIDFFWKSSCQMGGDFLEFYVDLGKKDYISGSVNWTQQIFFIPAGVHTLTWRYAKNSSFSAGLDCGWVDKITWTTYMVVPAVPSAPTGVSASDGTYDNKIRVIWRSSSGATSYKIYRATNPRGARLYIATSTRTSFDDSSATCDTTYYYWVRARNAVGTSGYSNYNSGYIEFSTPTGITASDGEYSDHISVTWDYTSGATSYELYRANAIDDAKVKIATTENTSFDDTNVTCCDDYYYWVKAKNSKCTTGLSDSDSGYLKPPPPPAPTGVSATDGDFSDEVRVTWNASSGASIYEVYRSILPNGAKSLVASTSNTTWNDTNLPCGIYFYWVKTKNASGTSDFSASDSGYATLCPPPTIPTGVSATDGVYTDKIRISWNPVDIATSYEIYRANTFGGEKVKIGTTTGTYYDDRIVVVSKIYYYWVKALRYSTASEFSLKFDTGYRLCPKAPTGIKATDDAYLDRIVVSWSASYGATSYELYRSIYPSASEGSKTLITTTTGTSYVDMFPICYSNCATCSVVSPRYYYWVKAKSADCISGYSGYDSGYTHCKPPAPQGVRASDGTRFNSVEIKWTVSLDEEYQYEVYRSTSVDGAKILLKTTSASSYLDTSVTCSKTYYYWVKRKDAKGFASDFSAYDAGYCDGN